MSEIANSVNGVNTAGPDDGALELRLFRTMIFSVIGAVMVATVLASWRVSFGLMLGGGLSLLNFHWLSTSVRAILSVAPVQKPRVRISRYFIRYLIVGIVVFAANQLQLVSLPATIAGLCAFVPALFVEASRQFYFAIINREESC
jgi:ATP synthase I subunit